MKTIEHRLNLKWLFVISVLMVNFCVLAQNHTWRVNNNEAYNDWENHQVFVDLQQAINSNLVAAGDTLYVEASATAYQAATLNRKLIIIGTGYFLDQNLGLQDNSQPSSVVSITFGVGSSGSEVYGIRNPTGSGTGYYFSNNPLSNITISRCYGYVAFLNSTTMQLNDIHIDKCYVTLNMGVSNVSNLNITNNLLIDNFSIGVLAQGSASNNVVQGNVYLKGFEFYNNIVLGNVIESTNNSSANIYNNIFKAAQPAWLTGGNNNFGLDDNYLFSTTSTTNDGRYQVKPSSSCPECYWGFPYPSGTGTQIGMFGGNLPYKISGIPYIPTISSLQILGTASPDTDLPVTVGTRTNN